MVEVSELKSEISRLEGQLKEILRKNETIKGEIEFVTNSVDKANNEIAEYNKKVEAELDKSKDILKASTDMMLNSYELELEIERIYHSFKNMEDANKKIRALQDDLYYSFDEYRTVRRVILALLDSFNLEVVSDDVLEKSIEKKQLKSPDYWLTAACVAILYWKKDNKHGANKALKNALTLDEKNTSIFFMIFNLLMGREEAAGLWFKRYQKSYMQKSDDDTFLMLISLLSGKVSDKNLDAISVDIKEYLQNQLKSKEAKQSQASLVDYVNNYFVHLDVPETSYYKNLANYCLDVDKLTLILSRAKNNSAILEFINKINNFSDDDKNSYLKNYLDHIVDVPSEKEKKLYEEIEYQEEIIKNKGNIELAKEIYEAKKKEEKSPLNLVNQMVGWIFDPKEKNISNLAIWNMFSLTKDIVIKAANAYFEDYRKLMTSERRVRINDYENICDLENPDREDSKVIGFYEKKKNTLLRKVSIIPTLLTLIIAIAGTALGMLMIQKEMELYYLGFLVGCGFFIITAINIFLYNRKRSRIKMRIQNECTEAQGIMKNICDEYLQYIRDYTVNDNISYDIIDALNKI